LEAGVVGSLDYKLRTAERADDLFGWLKENKYHYGGDEATLDFYVKKGCPAAPVAPRVHRTATARRRRAGPGTEGPALWSTGLAGLPQSTSRLARKAS
jgi:hypothetical protein